MVETDNTVAIERYFRGGLKLQHLKILLRLSQLGTISKVAESFHVTQPAISKQIAEVESALEVALIQRAGRSMVFTPAGELLLKHAREIFYQLDQAKTGLSAITAGVAGKLTIAAVPTVTPVIVPMAINELRQQAPNVTVELLEGTTDRLFPALLDGAADIVVSRTQAPSKEFRQAAIVEDPIVVVCGARHPLAYRRQLKWTDIDNTAWILPPENSAMHESLTQAMNENNLSFSAGCIKSTSLAASPALLASGSLIGLLPLSYAKQLTTDRKLVILPLQLSNLPSIIRLTWRRSDNSSILKLVRECFELVGREVGG